MAKKLLLLFTLITLLFTDAKAQPMPKDNACEAEIFCNTNDLNNFASAIQLPTKPKYLFPKGFCGGSVDGPSWFKFVAESATLELRYNYSNCGSVGQTGFQSAIFSTTNCNDSSQFTIVSNCIDLSSAQTSGIVTATGLVNGQTYYIFIDGYSGSSCDYNIDVLNGTIKTINAGNLAAPTTIYGPTEICDLSTVATFSVPRNPAATGYEFSISVNGNPPIGGVVKDTFYRANVAFTPIGVAVVTVRYLNNCTSGPTQTKTVTIGTNTKIELPPINLYYGQSAFVADSTFAYGPAPLATTQIENLTFMRPDVSGFGGCDTTYTVKITRFANTVGRVHFLRPNETVNIGGTNYTVTARDCNPIIVGNDTIYNAEQIHTLSPANTTLNCNSIRLNANLSNLDSCTNTRHFKVKSWYSVENGVYTLISTGNSNLFSSAVYDSIAVIIRDSVIVNGKPQSGYKIYNDTLFATLAGLGISDVPPQPTLINGKIVENVCQGTTVTYKLNTRTPLASNYTWTLLQSGGTFTTAQGDTTITVRWGNNITRDTLRLIASNTCFSSQPRDLVVNITTFTGLNAGVDEELCGLSTTFKGVSSGGTGVWTGLGSNPSVATIQSSNVATSPVSVTVAGRYLFAWSETKGTCVQSDTVAITFNPRPQTVAGSLFDSCGATRTQAFVRFNVTNGTAPYNVYISGTNTIAGTLTGNLFKSNPFTPGNYSFEIRDAKNCISTAIIGTQACATCGTSAGTMQAANLTICEGDTAKATFLGGQNLEPDDTLQYVIHTGDPKTGIISRSYTPQFALMNGMTFGTTYYISVIAGNKIGNDVDVNDGCFSSSPARIVSVVFNKKPTAVMSVVDSNLCLGSCATVRFNMVGQAPYTLKTRLANPTRDSVINTTNSNHSFTYCPTANTSIRFFSIRDASGCTDSTTVNKTVNFTISNPVKAGLDSILTICQGIDTTLNLTSILRGGDVGGAWSEISSTPSPVGAFNSTASTFRTRNIPSGTYLFNYIVRPAGLNSPCPADTATVRITIQFVPTADAGLDDTLTCANPVILIGGNTPVGTNITLRWSSINGFNGGNAPQQEVLKPDTYILTATSGVCSTRDTVIVRIDSTSPRAIITPITDSLTCLKDTLRLNGSGSTNVGVTYLWTIDDIPIDNQVSTLARRGGTYILSVANLSNGCIGVDSIKINENRVKPTVFVEPPKVLNCIDSIITLNANASSTGIGFTLNWQSLNRGHFHSDSTTLTPKVDSAGTYKLLITNTLNGCKDSTFVQVRSEVDVPQAEAYVNDSLDCYHPTVTISARGSSLGVGLSYLWLPNPGRIVSGDSTLNAVVDEPGKYIFVVKNDKTGCAAVDTLVVNRIDRKPENIMVNINKPACYGEQNGSLSVDTVNGGTSPYLYSLDGKVFTPRKSFNNLTAGAYSLYVQDASGCIVDTLINIVQDRQIGVSLGLDTLLKLGDSILLNVGVNITNIKRVIWSSYSDSTCSRDSSCMQQWVKPVKATTYKVKVIDTNNCFAEGLINISIDKNRPVFIPDAFTPNNDGNNDIFLIHGSKVVKNIKRFQIYDRWGEQIAEYKDFAPDNPIFGWDGKFKGRDVIPGVYTYYVEIEYLDGIIDLIEGNVTLVR